MTGLIQSFKIFSHELYILTIPYSDENVKKKRKKKKKKKYKSNN
jgi:hypothetical protein